MFIFSYYLFITLSINIQETLQQIQSPDAFDCKDTNKFLNGK